MPLPNARPLVPTEEEIRSLPCWARVAFAARCARRVYPLFQSCWPTARQKDIGAINRAIRIAETSAATACTNTAAAAAAVAAARAAAAAEAASENASGTALAAAKAVANVAACAAASSANANANGNAGGVANTAHIAALAASSADADVLHTRSAIRRDFSLLATLAMENGWDDKTPVSPDILGPLWPGGEPAGWPKPEETSGADSKQMNVFDDIEPLTLAIDPGSATPEEIAELLAEISKLYRMVGGSGINFRLADIWSLEGAMA